MLYSPPRSHNTQNDRVESECLIRFCFRIGKLMIIPMILHAIKSFGNSPGLTTFDLCMNMGLLSIAVCRLYVDGVDTGGKSRKKAKKVLVFLWSPLGVGSSIASRRVITVMLGDRCCQSCGCSGRCTVQAIWKVICWSFAALRKGKYPDRGPFGEPLSGVWASRAGQPLRNKWGNWASGC